MTKAVLHLFCGLIASGKSTLASSIAERDNAILIAEDNWTAGLWPGEIDSLESYRTHSRRLRTILWPLVGDILTRDVSVVLDFPANTRGQRASIASLLDDAPYRHVLHFLDTPPDLCRRRLAERNARGAHEYAPDPETFDRIARLFEPPAPDEGFTVRRWAESRDFSYSSSAKP
ncbi:MAG: ATP-binding protein [Alphaproteobacteria bacterium]|nr:ATP-binding protein [Alphaproteobacteria bacterium]